MHPLIKRLWKHYEPELKLCVARGEYERERELMAHVLKQVHEIRQDLIHERMQRPPFMTRHNGIYYMHPVTEENAHLLRRIG